MLVKLKDVTTIVGGGTPKRNINEYWNNGDIVWLSPSDLGKIGDIKNISDSKDKINQLGLDKSSAKLLPIGTVLYSTRATIGKIAINNIEVSTNQGFTNFICNNNLNNKYLAYCLKQFTPDIIELSHSTTFKEVNRSRLKEFKIPLPALKKQKEIAKTLDKAKELIELRKDSIKKLDELSKAVFIDMFGDPVDNEMGWDVDILNNITSKIGSGSTPRGGKNAYKIEGISLIRSLNIHDNMFKYKDLAFIDNEQADKLSNVILEEDDILLNITGASVCRCTIVPKQVLPARVNQHVAIIRLQRSMNSKFFLHLFISYQFKQKIMNIATSGGATREALTKENLILLKIIKPPIAEQNKFAKTIEKIEAQKALYEESLEKLEHNFESLLNESFS